MPPALERAFSFYQQERWTEAEAACRDALRTQPQNFTALHMLGIVKMQQGQPAQAVDWFAAAVKADRQSDAAFANYGMALAALGRFEDALASYERALAINPRNSDALRNRGDALCDLGRRDEAMASYSKALAINAGDVGAWVNRGLLLRDLGRPIEALTDLDKAISIDPQDFDAWNNHGVVLAQLDRQAEALAHYDRALALCPGHVDGLINRGNALLALKRPGDALASYDRALAGRPDLIEAHVFRGHALADLDRPDDALVSYQRALARKPDHVAALVNHARVLTKHGRHRDAIAQYAKLRTLIPDYPWLASDTAHAHAAACHWDELSRLERVLKERVATGAGGVDPFGFSLFDSSPEQQLACARTYLKTRSISAVQREWKQSEFPSDRIRIAYISGDFHRHATAYLVADLFELHDREHFDIIGVSFGPDDKSNIRARLIRSFDRFFDVAANSDVEIAKMLRDLGVHIAVDLKGYTTDARIGIAAQRAAPIQVSYLGYPGTMGSDFADYVIADPIVAPAEHERFFSEKIVQLPWSYQVNDRKRQVGAAPARRALGLPENAFVFCCFNNSWKINPGIFDVWMRFLSAVDGSVLWLYQSNELAVTNLRRQAQARGVDPQRLVFAPYMQLADHLARLTRADLVLDTLPYNAHTTASDALWVGVPFVTCTGPAFAGRVGSSLLRAVGLPELIAKSMDEYEALALELARDRVRLASVRDKLDAARATCPLFDSDRFRRDIEAAYTAMVDIWRAGESPRGFRVGSDGPGPLTTEG